MKKKTLLTVLATAIMQANAQNVTGPWHGNLDLGSTSLRLAINVNPDKSVTLDSPDQGAYGIKGSAEFFPADSLCVEIPSIGACYTAKLNDGQLKGTFTQMGVQFTLCMQRGAIEINRPQTPVPPFAYTTEELLFDNDGTDPSTGQPRQAGAAKLSGTLTLPQNFKNGGTVVVMVTGSGQQNRDEELFGHKPFLVMADYLARHGIASLRYDDRGTAKSTGNAEKSTIYDNMLDAEAAVKCLRKSHRFGRIGVLGHSEGGTIAYMLAARKEADFVVSMAGPAIKGDSVLTMQNRDLMLASGLDTATTTAYCTALGRILKHKQSNEKTTMPQMKLAMLTADLQLPVTLKQNLLEVLTTDNTWLNNFIAYDPADDIKSTLCPVFAIGGDKDLQVNAPANLDATKRLLPANKHNVVRLYPGLNHLFQPCSTGMVAEYGQIDTTIDETVMRDITDWIEKTK